MPYQVNGVDITLQPTTGRWVPREQVGMDGGGHPVYVGVREFELRWDLMTPAQFDQLQSFFAAVSTTGTCTMGLPKYASNIWEFFNYSGCTLSEPEMDVYFTEHLTSAMLLVRNISTVGYE